MDIFEFSSSYIEFFSVVRTSALAFVDLFKLEFLELIHAISGAHIQLQGERYKGSQ